MPVILSDETWTRIQQMLADYDAGILRVIPGEGLEIKEQVTSKANCPGTKIGTAKGKPPAGFSLLSLDVCIGGNSETHDFLVAS